MDIDEKLHTSTLPAYFNQQVEKRTVDIFNSAYEAAVEHATKNGFKKPSKGDFANAVIMAGMKSISLEQYFNSK